MPVTTKSTTKKPASTKLEQEIERNEAEENFLLAGEWETAWQAACDPKMDFFDRLTLIPEGPPRERECLIYVYRIWPEVANAPNQKKYIGKYLVPITQDTIKSEHGGGSYKAILKRGPRTLGECSFGIDGEPIYKTGQTARDGKPLAGNSQQNDQRPQRSEAAEIIRAAQEMVQGSQSKAAEAGFELMGRATSEAIALHSKLAGQQADSPTGNKISDQILNALLPNILKPADPMAQLTAIMTLVKQMQPAPSVVSNPDGAGGLTPGLTFVKEMFGVDNLAELIGKLNGAERGGGRVSWVSEVAGLASSVLDKIPGILTAWVQFEQYRARQLAEYQRLGGAPGQPGQPRPNGAIPGATLTGTRAQVISPPTPGAQTPAQPGMVPPEWLEILVRGILRAYDYNYDGFTAAAHIKLALPDEAMQVLRPLFADLTQVAAFVQNIPHLAALSTQAEWPKFQAEFLQEMLEEPEPADQEPEQAMTIPGAAKPN
jgi:hypothetical protein